MSAPLLALKNIKLNFGDRQIFEQVELFINEGDKIALIGRNGSGKSTLLKIANKNIEADEGEYFLRTGTLIRYLVQEPDLSEYENLLDYVRSGLGEIDNIYQAQYYLARLGLEEKLNPSFLSGGEIKRAALAKILATNADILLLDEPTNHLDLPTIIWLENELKNLKSAMLIISHDKKFLQNVTNKTFWLDRGKIHYINCGFAGFEKWQENFFAKEQQKKHKLKQQIKREEEWLRYGVTARRKRNVKRLANLAKLRKEREKQATKIENINFSAAKGKISGNIIIEAKNISKSFANKLLIKNFSTRILRTDRVGIVGANGVGKTSLLKLFSGQILPDEGEIKFGANIELALLDQMREQLNSNHTLKEAILDSGSDMIEINNKKKHIISYMQDFLFSPKQADMPLNKLSGGERARVGLAKLLSIPSNLLVLDEPTNDLDLETLDMLIEMLTDYHGTIIFVSHDRDFIDKLATYIIVYEGDGNWVQYFGGYSDYERRNKEKIINISSKTSVSNAGQRSVKKEISANNAKNRQKAKKEKKKLSFKQLYMLKTLPEKIEKLSQQIAQCEEKLAKTDYYIKDMQGFIKTSERLVRLQKELKKSEDEWLKLEIEREKLQN